MHTNPCCPNTKVFQFNSIKFQAPNRAPASGHSGAQNIEQDNKLKRLPLSYIQIFFNLRQLHSILAFLQVNSSFLQLLMDG